VKRSRKSTKLREEAPEYGKLSPRGKSFTFADLFCGIGGFRLAFERAGAHCVFSSDYDKFSQQTYEANFGEKPHGDIHSVAVADIHTHDILCAGFPCQPFSIAGVSKKLSLGRKHGFEDEKQGNLFFAIADIINVHRPAAFVLENVKNLKTHDHGNTYRRIMDILQDKLGYYVPPPQIIDARSVVPQHRERIFIVGFREWRDFTFPTFSGGGPKLRTILESRPDPKYTLTDHLWKYLRDYAAKHRAAGNGFGFGLVSPDDVARTLSARYFKDGSEILISQKSRNPRRLTPRECARLMGYPESFVIPVSDTQAYRQFGNSVVVPVVEAVAQQVLIALSRPTGASADLVLTSNERPQDCYKTLHRKRVTYRKTRNKAPKSRSR
jgi:DNA (cytosine-5)-methyltransferase 1